MLRSRRAYLRRVAFWQGVDWTLRLAAVLFMLHAFGLPVTVHNALLVQVSSGLASILPITPKGIGTEQGLLLYLLRGPSDANGAASFSVGMRITLIVVNLVLGFAALFVTLRTVHGRQHASYDVDRPRYSVRVRARGQTPARESVPSPSLNCYQLGVRGFKRARAAKPVDNL